MAFVSHRNRWIPALVALAFVGSCTSQDTPTSVGLIANAAPGKLTVNLTDDPFPFSSVARVDVYVARIDARVKDVSDDEAADTSSTGTDPDKEWVLIARPMQRYDLVGLRDGVTAALGSATLPAGKYLGLRIVIALDSSTMTLTGGTVLSLANNGIHADHGGRVAIKVRFDEPVVVDSTGATVDVDFDLANSFIMRGHTAAGGFNFRPLLRGVLHSVTGSVTGHVVGDSATGRGVVDAVVQLTRPDVTAQDTVAMNVVASTTTRTAGAFEFTLVPRGNYGIRVVPNSASGYQPARSSEKVKVTAGARTSVTSIVVHP